MHVAMEQLWPEMNLESIRARSTRFGAIILHEVVDNLKANFRLCAFRSSSLPDNVWYVCHFCGAHLIHLIITGGPSNTRELNVIGDVHAYHYVAQFPSHANSLLKNLRFGV